MQTSMAIKRTVKQSVQIWFHSLSTTHHLRVLFSLLITDEEFSRTQHQSNHRLFLPLALYNVLFYVQITTNC